MRSTFEFCLPTKAAVVPSGPDWLHEVKYDGYWLRIDRDGDLVRLFSRNGYDWSGQYPWIVEAARKIRQARFVLDGEAVVLGVDGISDFDTLHSRQHDEEVQFCAFDILVEGGDDLRKLPLHMRKNTLQRLLARLPEASSPTRSSVARSGQTYSWRRAGWGSRAWFRSIGIGRIKPAGPSIG